MHDFQSQAAAPDGVFCLTAVTPDRQEAVTLQHNTMTT